MNEHHIRAKVFLAAAERLEGVAATQTGAVRSAYREAADIDRQGNSRASERRRVIRFPSPSPAHPLGCRGRGLGTAVGEARGRHHRGPT